MCLADLMAWLTLCRASVDRGDFKYLDIQIPPEVRCFK